MVQHKGSAETGGTGHAGGGGGAEASSPSISADGEWNKHRLGKQRNRSTAYWAGGGAGTNYHYTTLDGVKVQP